MNKPSAETISAAYFGRPDTAAAIAVCGCFASADEDRQILKACRAMSDEFAIWQIFQRASADEVAARVRELN